MRLVFEQQIVHGPELSLGSRGLGSLGRHPRVRMGVLQREMPIYEPDSVWELLQQQFRSLHRNLAARALEVAVFDQDDSRMQRPLTMIGRFGRDRQGRSVRSIHGAPDAGNSMGRSF